MAGTRTSPRVEREAWRAEPSEPRAVDLPNSARATHRERSLGSAAWHLQDFNNTGPATQGGTVLCLTSPELQQHGPISATHGGNSSLPGISRTSTTSGSARWRRLEDLLTNRLAAARARSWRRWRCGNPCPAAGPFRPWDILGATSGSRAASDQRRDRYVTSDATDSDAAGIDSGERSDACRAERSQLRSRKRALRDQATPVWRAGHDPGR